MQRKIILFIVGAGHSGSTLLSKTLNAHSKIFALSELSMLVEEMRAEYSLCGCGQEIRKCNFWESINTRITDRIGVGIKENPQAFILSRPEKNTSLLHRIGFKLARLLALHLNLKTGYFRQNLANIRELYQVIFEATGAEILVDSSKSAKRAFMLGRNLKGFEVLYLHLVRDGRAVLHSYQKGYYIVELPNSQSGQMESKTYYAENKRTVKDSVILWKRDNQSVLFFKKFIKPANFYFLRYEDFTSNPFEELKGLIPWMKLEFEKEMLDLKRLENHMISGNASRINAKRIHEPVNSWEKTLNLKVLNEFSRRAGKLNNKFGYK